VIRWRLAVSSPSAVFPTCGYRGGDPADILVGDARDVSRWHRPLRPSRQRLGRLMLASPWASHAGVALGVIFTLTLTLTLALVDA